MLIRRGRRHTDVTSSEITPESLYLDRRNRLHQLIYVIPVLGVTHYWMAVKKDVTGPLTFATMFAVLYAFRIRKWLVRRTSARAAPSGSVSHVVSG